MSELRNKQKINVERFIADFVHGESEEELRQKYSLRQSQLVRLIEVLKERGTLTNDKIEERKTNLKIRFGSEDGPPDQEKEGKAAVDLSTGLVLHCPSCGASVKRNASRCEYCGAHLDFSLKGKTVPCPHCFASTPADGRFCIHCAKQVKGLVKEGLILEDRLCPRCSVPLIGLRVGDYSLMGCKKCGGTFIPHEVFEMIQETSDRVIFPTDFGKRTELAADEVVRYVRCPVCRNVMNRTNFARISGVIIDTCRGHGVWFDPGEMEKVMDFITRGGLQKAKELEIQRLKDEEKIAKIKIDQTLRQGGRGYSGWGEYGEYRYAVDIIDVVKRVFGI